MNLLHTLQIAQHVLASRKVTETSGPGLGGGAVCPVRALWGAGMMGANTFNWMKCDGIAGRRGERERGGARRNGSRAGWVFAPPEVGESRACFQSEVALSFMGH